LFTVVGFNPERFLICVFHASEKFDSDLEPDAGMQKIDAHPYPPMNNNIAPMPIQNPWAWVGMGMGTQCRALIETYPYWERNTYEIHMDFMYRNTNFHVPRVANGLIYSCNVYFTYQSLAYIMYCST
jgi:hypothetical protein